MKRLERGINHASVVLGKYNHDTVYPNPTPRLGATKKGKHTSQTSHRLTSLKLRPYACQLKPAEYLLNPHCPIISATPSWFLRALTQVISTRLPTIQPPQFKFELIPAEAIHNMNVIKSHGSLEAAIKAQTNSPVSYGSEFRPPWILHPLMHRHPLWYRTAQCLGEGTIYKLRPISDEARTLDLKAQLKYGNHKSTEIQPDLFTAKMATEVSHGFALPLPPAFAFHIPDAEAAPHEMITQETISDQGEIIPKDRVTHDQSYSGEFSKELVNSRVIDEELAPCMYEHMLLRCTHYII